jgi:hypothetical protein
VVARGVGSEIRLRLDRTLLRLLCVGTEPCNSVLTVVMMEARGAPRPRTLPTAVTDHVCEPCTEQIISQLDVLRTSHSADNSVGTE